MEDGFGEKAGTWVRRSKRCGVKVNIDQGVFLVCWKH